MRRSPLAVKAADDDPLVQPPGVGDMDGNEPEDHPDTIELIRVVLCEIRGLGEVCPAYAGISATERLLPFLLLCGAIRGHTRRDGQFHRSVHGPAELADGAASGPS